MAWELGGGGGGGAIVLAIVIADALLPQLFLPSVACDLFQTAYMNYLKVKWNGTDNIPSNKEAWLRPLIDGSFFAEQPQYRNDVVLSNDGSVSASRFYVTGPRADHVASAEEGLMVGVRELAAGSEPQMIPYCPEFIFYESYLSVRKDTLLPVGVTIIGSYSLLLLTLPSVADLGRLGERLHAFPFI